MVSGVGNSLISSKGKHVHTRDPYQAALRTPPSARGGYREGLALLRGLQVDREVRDVEDGLRDAHRALLQAVRGAHL